MPLVAPFLLAATLHATPEHALTPPVPQSQPYEQYLGDVAGGSDAALIVWSSLGHRDHLGISDRTIHAARIGRNGEPLDARPLVLDSDPGVHFTVRVARGAREWLVAWSANAGVFARIVRDDGTMGETVRLGPASSFTPVLVASNGTRYLVAWERAGMLQTAPVDANGQRIGAIVEHWPTVLLFEQELIATPDGGFVVTVAHDDGMDAMFLTRDGVLAERERIIAGARVWSAAAAYDDDTLVLAWSDADGVHVRRGGELTQRIRVSDAGAADLLVLRNRVYLLMRTSTGITLQPIGGGGGRTWGHEPEDHNNARVAALGDRIIVAMSVSRFDFMDVDYTIVEATLRVAMPQRHIYVEPRLQLVPAIAKSAAGGLAAWIEREEEARRHVVMATLLDGEGRPAGAPWKVAEDVLPGSVAVASDGNDFVVVWHGTGPVSLRVRRVLHDGSMPGAEQSIGSPAGSSCAMWNGSAFVVGYAELLGFGRGVFVSQPRLRELRGDGTWTDPVDLAGRIDTVDVACASSTQSSLFVWDEADGAIRGVVRTAGGALSTAIPLGVGGNPAVASNGDNFAVAWLLPDSIERIRVSAFGTVESPLGRSIPASVDARIGGGVALSASGSGYYLAWGSSELFVAPLAANGELTAEPVRIATLARHPRLSGELLAYERDVEPVIRGRWRAFVRALHSALGRRRAVR